MPIIALWAALAMVVQDVLATVMVIAENHKRAALAGALDSVGWIAAILTTSISVTSLQGHSLSSKAWVIGLVTAANFFGTYTGVKIGQRYATTEN